jgi:tetratricopeptide (TPR) repeat protein
MLETVRAYAALQLTAAGERDDAMEGLVRYVTSEASLAAGGLVGPAQVEWLGRVREDLESYRSALTWLIERGRAVEAAHIAWALTFFWLIRGHASEGLRWYEEILKLPALTPVAESQVLVGAGTMLYTHGDFARARSVLTRGCALARETDHADTIAFAEYLFGHVEHASGHLEAARDWFVRSLERFRAQGIAWGTGHALSGLAWIAQTTGDVSAAEHLLDEAAGDLHRAGPWFLSLSLYVRAILAVKRGDADAALAFARDSLTTIRDVHDRFASVYTMLPLAAAAVLAGDDAWAARILGARDGIIERAGARVDDPTLHELQDQVERGVRARLGPQRWAQAHAAGRVISIDGMLTDIEAAIRRRASSRRPNVPTLRTRF